MDHLLLLFISAKGVGDGEEGEDKVESSTAEENRDGGHSVSNLGRIIEVFTVNR